MADKQPIPREQHGSSWPEIIRFFHSDLRNRLAKLPLPFRSEIIEIRCRVNRPVELNCGKRHVFLTEDGGVTDDFREAGVMSIDELRKLISALTTGSYYALEAEIAQGYIGLPGGHRVGFAGRVVQNAGKIQTIQHISSVNFRIARRVAGIARPLLPLLWKDGRFLKTLIISPPAAGKTTLLREIIREFSYGVSQLNIPGHHIGVVDERSELAGSYLGVPQLDLGPRSDILDACPKEEGVYLLLRSMNPQIIATDEVGREKDQQIIADIINAGVSFITTAHARNLTEAMFRPGLRRILENGSIERLITLSNRFGPGTLESVKAGAAGPELWLQSQNGGEHRD
jgi:stage III sporulation protein AA